MVQRLSIGVLTVVLIAFPASADEAYCGRQVKSCILLCQKVTDPGAVNEAVCLDGCDESQKQCRVSGKFSFHSVVQFMPELQQMLRTAKIPRPMF